MSDEDYGIWMETEEIGQPDWVMWAVAVPFLAAILAGLAWFIVQGIR